MVTKTYLPSNLCDGSYSSVIIDNSDSSDSSDRSDSSDSSDKKSLFIQKKTYSTNFFLQFFSSIKKINNWNSAKTSKLKLWWKSNTQIVMNLKNSNYDKT